MILGMLATKLCSSQIQVEALSPNMMVFGDGAFGRQLDLNEVTKVGLSQWD